MNTYEVQVDLDTGYTLNVIVAASSHQDARSSIRKVMSGLRYQSGLTAAVNSDEWTVSLVEVRAAQAA
jgi:hypothetical protein